MCGQILLYFVSFDQNHRIGKSKEQVNYALYSIHLQKDISEYVNCISWESFPEQKRNLVYIKLSLVHHESNYGLTVRYPLFSPITFVFPTVVEQIFSFIVNNSDSCEVVLIQSHSDSRNGLFRVDVKATNFLSFSNI